MPIVLEVGDRSFVKKWQQDHPGVQLFQALEDMADFIRDAAVSRAPGRTKLAVDSGVEEIKSKGAVQIAVGLKRNPKFAIFVHQGTGIFGDFRRPIFAGHGNVFAFEDHGAMKFAKVIKGQRPQPFLWEAVELAEKSYIPFRVQELGLEIS